MVPVSFRELGICSRIFAVMHIHQNVMPWSWAAADRVEWVCGEVLVMSVVVLGGRRDACIRVGGVVAWMDSDSR